MWLVKKTGPVSNFREETQIKTARTSDTGRTRFKTEKLINFRVGNRPVSMKLPKGIDLTDGDEATVVGSNSGGGIKAVLVRNDSTEITYGMSTLYVLAWAIFTTFAGVVTVGIGIGLVLIPLGFYLFYKVLQLMRAHMLMAT